MKKKRLTLADLRRIRLRYRALNQLLISRAKGECRGPRHLITPSTWSEAFDYTQQCARAAAVSVRDLSDAAMRLQKISVNLKK